MKKRNVQKILAGAVTLLVMAGAVLFVFSPQLAGPRFQLTDWMLSFFEEARYPQKEIALQEISLKDLLADSRVTVDQSLLLVRPGRGLPEDFSAAVSEYRDSGLWMEEGVHQAYEALSNKIKERFDAKLYVSSAYRTREKQLEITQTQGELAAGVDESEHQTGLALDVYVSQYAGKSFLRCETGRWVNRNCWQYGFIIRYPYYGEKQTGLPYEPWHLRYVGKPHAQLMMQNRLTLEEYLDSLEFGKFYAFEDVWISRQTGEQMLTPEDYQSATVSSDNQGGWVLTFYS